MKEILEKAIEEYCKKNQIKIEHLEIKCSQHKNWFETCKFDIGVIIKDTTGRNLRFALSPNHSGCGSALLHDYSYYTIDTCLIPIFDIVCKCYATQGNVGTIITTQGGDKTSARVQNLVKMGFTVVSEYPNKHRLHHGDKQCLLIKNT